MMITSKFNMNYGYDIYHYSKILNKNKIVKIIYPRNQKNNESAICYLLPPFATNRFFWVNAIKNVYDYHGTPFILAIPESGRNWFINDASDNRYEDYLIKELIPLVENTLLLNPNATKRIIGGFSMGGATAIFMGLKYPLLFNTLFSISGAFDAAYREGDPYHQYRDTMDLMIPTTIEHKKVWGPLNSETRKIYNLDNLIKQLDKSTWQSKLILEVGVNDYPRIVTMNRNARDLLTKHGIHHYYSEQSGTHNAQYTENAIQRIFKELQA